MFCSLFFKSVTELLQIYTTEFTMLSTVDAHSTIKTMTLNTAGTINRTNTHNRVVAEEDGVILCGVGGTSVNPSCANAASLKDDFEDASSHMFLSSDVSSLLNTAKYVAYFV